MLEYPKIHTIYKRDMETKGNPIIVGQYTFPEFEYLEKNRWVYTEKVDGTNIRIGLNGASNNMLFAGRTDNAQTPTFLLTKLQELFPNADKFIEVFGDDAHDVVLFGEGYGARIQKGGGNYIPDGVGFVLFDVLVGEWWLKREDVEDVAQKLGLDVVPIIGEGDLREATARCMAGFKSKWGDFIAEGMVLRPATELRTRSGHRIITKLKYKDFIHQPVESQSVHAENVA